MKGNENCYNAPPKNFCTVVLKHSTYSCKIHPVDESSATEHKIPSTGEMEKPKPKNHNRANSFSRAALACRVQHFAVAVLFQHNRKNIVKDFFPSSPPGVRVVSRLLNQTENEGLCRKEPQQIPVSECPIADAGPALLTLTKNILALF